VTGPQQKQNQLLSQIVKEIYKVEKGLSFGSESMKERWSNFIAAADVFVRIQF
jgi:hypothetical protein